MTAPIPGATSRRTLLIIVGIAVLTLVFRAWVAGAVADRPPGGGDPLYYHEQANLLADGHGFPEPFGWIEDGTLTASAVHPPGFTVWLAGSSLLGFDTVFAHKVMSGLAGALTVLVLGLLGRRLGGDRVGILAAVLAGAHPNLWVIDGALMPEALFGLTIAAILFATYWALDQPGWRRGAVVGAAIGAAALVRGEALLLVPLLAVPLAWPHRAWKTRITTVLGVGLAAAVVIAPWVVRNVQTFDRPLLSVNSDEVLRNANCDVTWDGYFLGFWSLDCYQPTPPAGLDEAERAAFWRRAGVQYVEDHLRRAPAVAAARVGRVWDVYRPSQNALLSTVEGRSHDVARAGQVVYFALLPLAALGTWAMGRRPLPRWPLLSMAIVVTVTAVYAYGVIRFRVPAEVATIVLAAVGIDHVVSGRRPTAAP